MLLIKDLRKSFREPDGTTLPILDVREYHLGTAEQAVLMGAAAAAKPRCCT